MHKLSYLEIKNFKSIKNSEFILNNFTPIIGYNNVGKSNILDAIIWLINKSVLTKNNFNNTMEEVVIIGEISGISEKILSKLTSAQKKSIEKYIFEDKLKIKRIQSRPSCKISEIKLEVYDSDNNNWIPNPTGIDGALKALYPEPIVIKAMDNTEEDIGKFKTTSTIGKLISEIMKPIEEQYSSSISDSMKKINDLLSINGENRICELDEFDTRINEKLNNIFPELKIKLNISTPTIAEIFKSGSLKIYENNNDIHREIDDFGTGAKRTIQMTLIRQLAEMKREESITTTLLIIDEPELYLHPQAIEQLRISLKKLSNEGYQVIFTTHSAQMVCSNDIGNTIILRKTLSDGTMPRKTLYSAIKDVEENHDSQLELIFNLTNSSQILFSEKIILTEGKTEKKLLPFLYEKITNKTFLLDKMCLLEQGGKTNTQKTQNILNIMGLENKAIVDLDFIFTNAIKNKYLLKDDTDILKCKDLMKKMEEKGEIVLDNTTGLPKKDKGTSAEEFYKIFAKNSEAKIYIDNLCKKMREKNIWVWDSGAIESKLNINNKTEKEWAKFKETLIAKKDEEVRKMYPDLGKLFDWINS